MKVKFVPQSIELEIQPNQSVMDLAHKNGIFIKSICNGIPNCAECRVRIVEGEANVMPPGVKELSLVGTGYFIDQRRLSCQLKCFGDLTVDLTEQEAKQKAGPKKILGNRKMDQDTSHAVNSMIMNQDDEMQKAIAAAEQKKEQRQHQHQRPQNQQRGGGQQNQQRHGKPRHHHQNKNKNQNQNNQNQKRR